MNYEKSSIINVFISEPLFIIYTILSCVGILFAFVVALTYLTLTTRQKENLCESAENFCDLTDKDCVCHYTN